MVADLNITRFDSTEIGGAVGLRMVVAAAALDMNENAIHFDFDLAELLHVPQCGQLSL